jgi:hypothetical protein
MSKPKVLRVIEVSHPDRYNIDKLRYEDLYLKATKLSDTRECLVYLRMENRPYVIVVLSGTLDDEGVRPGRMRLFCVFRTLKEG